MGSSVLIPQPGQPKTGPDPGFKSGSIPNVVSFAFKDIGPPSALYIQRDDIVHLQGWTNQANEIVAIRIRLLQPAAPIPGQPDVIVDPATIAAAAHGGVITTINQQLPLTAALRSINQLNIPLQEGYLLSLGVRANVASTRGQTFVTASVDRGQAAVPDVATAQMLVADYVTGSVLRGWPGSRVQDAVEGAGFVHAVTVANPAAGADWSFVVPAGARMRISSLNAVLTTSATVANRQVTVKISSGGNVIYTSSATANIAATTTQQVSMQPGNVPAGVVTTILQLVLPGLTIMSGADTLAVQTVGLQAADQWSNIALEVEEWIEL